MMTLVSQHHKGGAPAMTEYAPKRQGARQVLAKVLIYGLCCAVLGFVTAVRLTTARLSHGSTSSVGKL